jgi:MFS family permease
VSAGGGGHAEQARHGDSPRTRPGPNVTEHTAGGVSGRRLFANLTSGILAVADPRHRGAIVALYSCIGFGGGFVGTLLFGIALDLFGGAARLVVWTAAFATCAIECVWLVPSQRPCCRLNSEGWGGRDRAGTLGMQTNW